MKTAISLPDETFLEAEQVAKRLGMSRSELYVLALEAFLRQQRQQAITETLNAVYGARRHDSVLSQVQLAPVTRRRR